MPPWTRLPASDCETAPFVLMTPEAEPFLESSSPIRHFALKRAQLLLGKGQFRQQLFPGFLKPLPNRLNRIRLLTRSRSQEDNEDSSNDQRAENDRNRIFAEVLLAGAKSIFSCPLKGFK
jgi:hypothetical protein